VKKNRRLCSMALVVALGISSMTVTAASGEAKKTPNKDENYLSMALQEVVNDKGVVLDVAATVEKEGMEARISVPKDGVYTFGIAYSSAMHEEAVIALEMKIDGTNMFENVEALQLDKIYCDAGKVRTDGIGNEFAPEQVAYEDCVLIYPKDSETSKNYTVKLTKGEHVISFASINDELYISDLIFAVERTEEYKQPSNEEKYYMGDPIVTEGEDSLWKNSAWLISLADNGSDKVTPSDPIVNRINYIGGSNWKHSGEIITWDVKVPEDGYYSLGFSYRQSLVVNYTSYRTLLIDGVSPFAEVEEVAFPYSDAWNKMCVADKEGSSYAFYLTKGVHTIALQVTLGDYYEVCERLEAVVTELGDLNLKMTMITGETVDISRDYDLFKYIPDLEERLTACVTELEALEKEIDAISGGESSSYALVLRNMVRVINQMLENQYTATRYKSDFYTNYSSLSVCFSDMQSMPLDIDQVILASPKDEKAFQSKMGFLAALKQFGFSIKRFVGSFSRDYNSVSGDMQANEKLTLWVNWGQDQARVLNSLIQTEFATQYGIDVEVQVTNASIVQAILSGNGPDLVLQQARTEPVNLAMRGALYDLKNFDDYEEVLENFADGAETPYYYQDGLYALPDTQNFYMMFYRTDIFEELEIEVPTTWEEFVSASKKLLHNQLSVCLPYTQIASQNVVNTGVGGLTLYPTLLLQNDIPLYAEDGKSTTLTTPESLNVFSEWMDYYTEMKFPTESNFYNRFRSGTSPLGIAVYSTAVTLTTEAPELEGKWKMVPVPGVENEDGSINNATSGSGTGCSILNMSENKEAAWTFLKWWTSEETQTAFSTNLESILGPLARVAVSNTEALKSLSWTEEELTSILEARENVCELPEYPGGYQVSRSIDMAFYNVVNKNVNPKDVLTEWGKIADNEILRKWEQYVKEER